VLHALIERLGTFGVTALDDLLAFRGVSSPAAAAKLRLVRDVPRGPGIYLFRDACGRVVYVGKAANLRARLRSWFGSSAGPAARRVLRVTADVEHVATATLLEAEVLEVRAIARHTPRFNRRRRRGWYVEVASSGAGPLRTTVRRASGGHAVTLGPFPSRIAARAVRDAVEHPHPRPDAPGPAARAGRALETAWRRHEEAQALQRAGRVVLHVRVDPGGAHPATAPIVLDAGRLAAAGTDRVDAGPERARAPATRGSAIDDRSGADERAVVARWLGRAAARGEVRLVSSERRWACALPPSHPARDHTAPTATTTDAVTAAPAA
jgi:hypothetical protein